MIKDKNNRNRHLAASSIDYVFNILLTSLHIPKKARGLIMALMGAIVRQGKYDI